MTNKAIFVAISMALIATPASAQNSATQKSDKDAAVDQKKYCIQYDNIVGSRVARTQCKTKSEWAKERVDVDKMLKGE